jgi:hypothetical protein
MTVGVFCIEGRWEKQQDDRRPSVRPWLTWVCDYKGAQRATYDCATASDLEYRIKHAYRRGFGILYFAYHGWRGYIEMENSERVTLERLAGMMGRRFEGWAVHFGSCGVLGAPTSQIRAFKRRTGATTVSGYERTIGWKKILILETAWLWQLQDGKRRLPNYIKELANQASFVVY